VDTVPNKEDRREWTYGVLLADTERFARLSSLNFAPNSADWVILPLRT